MSHDTYVCGACRVPWFQNPHSKIHSYQVFFGYHSFLHVKYIFSLLSLLQTNEHTHPKSFDLILELHTAIHKVASLKIVDGYRKTHLRLFGTVTTSPIIKR